MIYGIDVAYYEGHPDWRRVHDSGIRFGFSKVSENTDYVNSTWKHNRAGMEALPDDFVPGAYHFLHSGSDPAEQARHFLSSAGDLTDWMVALDVERVTDSHGHVTSKPTAAHAHAWVTEFKKHAGDHTVIGYFPRWYWDELDRPDLSFFDSVWASHYVSGSGSASVLYRHVSASWWKSYGGGTVAMLQHSSSGSVPGVDGECDVNAYKGTLTELRKLNGLRTRKPKPVSWPGRELKLTSPMTHDAEVTWVQQRLNVHGANPKVTVDGVFGPNTEAALKSFQIAHELTVDGVVGKVTWTALSAS